MADINLKGMGVALITPFKEDESVDYEALARLVDYQLQNGTDYLVVLGTTAETPTLTEEEKEQIIHLVVTKVNGRIPIVLGMGGNCTRAIVDQLKSKSFDGIDAILSVVPYYNKPSQEGIYQHYKAIAEATTLPIVLYNVPGRTGVNMTAETTLRIARDFKNVIAVKEASGNITQMDDIIKNKPKNFNVISGDDGITFPLITLPFRVSSAAWSAWRLPEITTVRARFTTALRSCSASFSSTETRRAPRACSTRWASSRTNCAFRSCRHASRRSKKYARSCAN